MQHDNGVYWVMIMQIILGYFSMLKCCVIGTIIVCMCPVIIRALRNGNRPDANWTGASTEIIRNITKKKFKAGDQPEGAECAICMVEYAEGDEIT